MLRPVKTTVASFILLASLQSNAAIFGVDNRHNVTEALPPVQQQYAHATAIAVLSSNVETNAQGRLDLLTDKLEQFCKDEPFSQDPSLSYSCTGFLIAPDLLVTAGHCAYAVNSANQTIEHETKLACETFSWLFDFQDHTGSKAATKNIDPSKLFKCKEIIYARQTEHAPFVDYALIRLDRPANGRTPFKIAADAPRATDSLAMTGFPFGQPMKYTDGGRVTKDDKTRDSFLTSLDAFEGNSGSPVFNQSGDVVGILVGGTPMANTYTSKSTPGPTCERTNKCTEDAKRCFAVDTPAEISKLAGYQGVGSEVQRIQPISDLLRH